MLKPFLNAGLAEAGCDEAGRGCLAGPVFAAAVILPQGFSCDQLDDSKRLSPKTRSRLRALIESEALAWAVAEASAEEIDRLNILRASILAMHRALQALAVSPQFILVDGNRFAPFGAVPHKTIVKGDATYQSIAAASILAKTHRDARMLSLHSLYPAYRWASNKGYPTPEHREAIRLHGLTPEHRRSFNLLGSQAQLLLPFG